jgi:putative flippase GtrA
LPIQREACPGWVARSRSAETRDGKRAPGLTVWSHDGREQRRVQARVGGAGAAALAIEGVAAGLDILTLVICVYGFAVPNPVAAMAGVVVGGIFAFFANRRFAFRDHKPELAPQAIKFAISTGGAMLIHAGLVWLLANRWGSPVVIAKLAADVAVFSIGQLFVLRYLVFPKRKDTPAAMT